MFSHQHGDNLRFLVEYVTIYWWDLKNSGGLLSSTLVPSLGNFSLILTPVKLSVPNTLFNLAKPEYAFPIQNGYLLGRSLIN